MFKYEICVVINHKLDDEQRKAEIDKIKNYIVHFGGTVIEPVEEWGKRKLAYEINHMNEAYYYFIAFEGSSSTPNEVESFVLIMESVIRFLIVKQ